MIDAAWRSCAGSLVALGLVGCGGPPAPARPLGPPLDAVWPALDGGEVRLSELRDQRVVIHVFTTSSTAAALDEPALAEAAARPDVAVVGLALDREGYALVAPWRKGADVRYLVALGTEADWSGAGPLGPIRQIPTTVVLDGAGREVARLEHPVSSADLTRALARAIP
ncbi:MAG: TlpA disulfide reductase family protein [Kofleriaceae bacterium]